tara:strand:+ start:2461 stop:2721 length:261 start_codon:yes stop_codon:yes gene_type:complete
MRLIAKIVGALWMGACALLWLSTGFVDYGIAGNLPPIFANWGVVGLIAAGGFGLSFFFILLGGVGYLLWMWGSLRAKPPGRPGPHN